jgi:molecular chaperone GrpE
VADEKKHQKPENNDVIDLSGFDTKGGEESADAPADSALKAELDKCKSDYLYLRADFDNYRKSVIKERSDLIKYGSERLLTDLLDLLDNFDRALSFEVTPENLQSFKEGMDLTRKGFDKMLTKFGVSALESEGQPFDPSLHEALSSEETDKVAPGHIARVFKKAYKLHDRVIRPAQVVVAKEPPKGE